MRRDRFVCRRSIASGLERCRVLSVVVAGLWLPAAHAQTAASTVRTVPAALAEPGASAAPSAAETHAHTALSPAASCPVSPEQLPPLDQVRASLFAHPSVLAAQARRTATGERADAIRAGTAEFQIRSLLQRRSVRDPGDRYTEGQIGVERPLRLWGKAGADSSLADATAATGVIDVADSLHEGARQLLALWFDWQRAAAALRLADEDLALARQLSMVVASRIRVGDAARTDALAVSAEVSRLEAAMAGLRAGEAASRVRLSTRFPGLSIDDGALLTALDTNKAFAVNSGAGSVAGAAPAADAGIGASAATPSMATEPLSDDPAILQRYLQASHELRLATAEADRLDRLASRQALDRYPDPSVGVFGINERGGAERIVGLSLSIPLAGPARAATARASAADASAARLRGEDLRRQVAAEFDAMRRAARGQCDAAAALTRALQQQQAFADKTARAYSLGEAGIAETLYARRLVNEARLNAGRARLDAAETVWRLRVDLHEVWDFDD